MGAMFDFREDLPDRLCDDLIGHLAMIPALKDRKGRDTWLEESLNSRFCEQIKYSTGRVDMVHEDLNHIFVTVDGHRSNKPPREWYLVRLVDRAQNKVPGTVTSNELRFINLQIKSTLDIWSRRLDERAYYDDEFRETDRLLFSIQSRQADALFLNFCSPDKFDRAFLLSRIERVYRQKHPVCLVLPQDFSSHASDGSKQDIDKNLCRILDDFYNNLSPQKKAGLPNFQAVTQTLDLVALICQITQASPEPSLLLFQDYHKFPISIQTWFEDEFFPGLRRAGKAGVIMTSEYALSFHNSREFPVSIEVVDVPTLDPHKISRLSPELAEISDGVYALTGGIRYLVLGLAQLLVPNQTGPVLEIDVETKRSYFSTYIDKEVLPLFDENIHRLLFIMAILRRFKFEILNEVDGQYQMGDGAPPIILKSSQFFPMLGNWVDTDEFYNHELDESLQHVLREYLKFNHLGFYSRIIEIAQEIYRQRIYGKDWKNYLTVYLYSVVDECLLNSDAKSLITERLQAELRSWVTNPAIHQVDEDELQGLTSLADNKILGKYLSQSMLFDLVERSAQSDG